MQNDNRVREMNERGQSHRRTEQRTETLTNYTSLFMVMVIEFHTTASTRAEMSSSYYYRIVHMCMLHAFVLTF